jgi:hypothetical protein
VDGPVLRPLVFGEDPYAGGQHRGIDIGGSAGATVRAPAGGSISFAGTVPTGGRTVAIRTSDGYSVTLVHLGTISVARGADVREGAPVGTVGPSGEPELAEPYVHLGIRVASDPNGYVDPLALLPPPADATPGAEPAPDPVSGAEPAVSVKAPPGAPAPEPTARPAAATHTPWQADVSVRAPARPAHAHLSRRVASPSMDWTRLRVAAPAFLSLPRAAAQFLEPAAATRESGGGRRDSENSGAAWLWALVASAAGAAGAAGLRLRRQIGDAAPANRAAPVFLEARGPAAEDARGPRFREQDRLVLDGDLERILLPETEALADLDRDDDSAELVDVPDDAGRRSTGGASRRSHRLSRVHDLRAAVVLRAASGLNVPRPCRF